MSRVAAGILLAVLAAPVLAHTNGRSHSEWTLTETGGTVHVRISQRELTRAQLHPEATPEYAARVGERLAASLQLWSSTTPCEFGPVTVRSAASGIVRADWSARCEGPPTEVRTVLLREEAPGHLHFARIHTPDGRVHDRVLTHRDSAYRLPAEPPRDFAGHVRLGLFHIVTGYDHLAFLVGLLLLAGALRELVWAVTGFTLAHSLTLAAASAGWVQAHGDRVEAVIGYSIAVVAVEALWARASWTPWMPATLFALLLVAVATLPPLLTLGLGLFTLCYFGLLRRVQRPARLRLAMTFLFGLVHGLGFAGVLAEFGRPASEPLPALLGFNLGVEAGQLAIIALLWPLLRRWRTGPGTHWAPEATAAGIGALGVYWFVVRSLG